MLNFLDSLINVYDEKPYDEIFCDKLCDEICDEIYGEKSYGDKLCDEIYGEIYGEICCDVCHLSVLWHPSTRLDVSILHLQLPRVPLLPPMIIQMGCISACCMLVIIYNAILF